MTTLKPQSNSNTVIGTLAVDGWTCYIWYSNEGPGGLRPCPVPSSLYVTAHPSTASVQITVLLYDGPLFCGFNVAIKGLKLHLQHLE